ncbi:MAG: AbrB/MazE/SpoVT family DNA-binding domain-containing protein [Chloroflexota bacterium]|nr:MAG: AbrB/MazE/SpoVT family DNA-binding domain-containing protein [Chloroflexota bacterium]
MPVLTSKGQVTLPKRIREYLGLNPGSQVDFEIDANGVHVRKVQSGQERTHEWFGALRERFSGRTSDELVDEVRGRPDPD